MINLVLGPVVYVVTCRPVGSRPILEMAFSSLLGQLLCSQGRRLIKQMLVNKQVIAEMNLHLTIKKSYLNCFSYEHINLVSEMSTNGKRANMWQMGNLSSIAFVVLPERTVAMATK